MVENSVTTRHLLMLAKLLRLIDNRIIYASNDRIIRALSIQDIENR